MVHGVLCGLYSRTQGLRMAFIWIFFENHGQEKERGVKCTLKASTWKKKVTSTHILLTTSNHVVMPKYKRVVRYSCLICSAEPELFDGEYSTIIVIWCEQMIHWKSPWCWERLKAGGEGVRRWDGWTASLLQWTWVWANSRRWWGTGRPWHALVNGITKSPTRLGNWKQQQYN